MAKYIIELEDEPMIANSFHQEVDELWKAKGFNSLVFDQNGIKKLTPYTEPDREADEMWDFVNTVYGLSDEELYEIFDDGNYCDHSYQEVKAKYEAWKKQKQIKIGDEVAYVDSDALMINCVILDKIDDDGNYYVFNEDGCVGKINSKDFTKTGNHYHEVVELLKKLGRI